MRKILEKQLPLQMDFVQEAAPSPLLLGRWERLVFRLRLLAGLFMLTLAHARSPLKALRWLRQLRRRYQSVFGAGMAKKVVRVGERYFWNLGAPGFPSPAFTRNWENELNREFRFRTGANGIRNVFFAVTSKCTYHCAHCFEWDNLHQPETLERSELLEIVKRYQEFGAGQIIFSGGEPMLRWKDIVAVLENSGPDSDFRVFTSGFSFTAEKAQRLKRAGLTGVTISLDHWREDWHDRFRGHEGAYRHAVEAVGHARAAGLVCGLSICVTREMCDRDNLRAYFDLAKDLGVCFVQLLDPVPVGHFAGKEVCLPDEQLALLEDFYLRMNNDPAYREYPIVQYQGYHQRRMGCMGAGNRFLYINPQGYVQRCPFCPEPIAHALAFPVEDTVRLLEGVGCASRLEEVRSNVG